MNDKPDKEIKLLKRVSWKGGACPDGADCPARFATSWNTHITVGRPARPGTPPVPVGQIAIETPWELWDGPRPAGSQDMRITSGRLITDPAVLATLRLPPGETAIETLDEPLESTP